MHKNKTSNILTKYEKVKMLGLRAEQIQRGSTVYIDICCTLLYNFHMAPCSTVYIHMAPCSTVYIRMTFCATVYFQMAPCSIVYIYIAPCSTIIFKWHPVLQFIFIWPLFYM